MLEFIRHSYRFVLFAAIQSLIFNQLEIGFGIQFMIYPLFILLLPYQLNVYVLLFISFSLGLIIDAISNTYGLHASSALLVAYMRPYLFKIFEPRDGYEQPMELSYRNMPFGWILYVHGSLFLLHHLWFFTIEIFKFNEMLFVLQKTMLSLPCSFIVGILFQLIFVKPASNR